MQNLIGRIQKLEQSFSSSIECFRTYTAGVLFFSQCFGMRPDRALQPIALRAPAAGDLKRLDCRQVDHPVSVKGVLLIEGQVVLVKNPRNEWELPGGRMDPGETHAQTLAREFAEELSIEVKASKRIDSYAFEVIPGRHVNIVTYGCTLAGEFAPRLSEEHSAHCLWPVGRLSEINLPQGYRRSVEKWADAARGKADDSAAARMVG